MTAKAPLESTEQTSHGNSKTVGTFPRAKKTLLVLYGCNITAVHIHTLSLVSLED